MDQEKKRILGIEIDPQLVYEGLLWLGVLAGFEGLVWLVTGSAGLGWRVDGNVVTDSLASTIAEKDGQFVTVVGLINMAINAINRNRVMK